MGCQTARAIASCVDDALLQPGFALTDVARRVAPTPVQIAFALQTEGFLKSLIARLHYDRQAVMMIPAAAIRPALRLEGLTHQCGERLSDQVVGRGKRLNVPRLKRIAIPDLYSVLTRRGQIRGARIGAQCSIVLLDCIGSAVCILRLITDPIAHGRILPK
jgi:hypothetical protein